MPHQISHKQERAGWLRAAVLGANDGIISTSSLIVGMAAASSSKLTMVITGIAGLVAGAVSMAAGEYVSVCSQADLEKADLQMEADSIDADFLGELDELADIYQTRGLEPSLAKKVARQLMAFDALGAHARDDIGISDLTQAKPIQAALSSAASFTVGALLPVLLVILLQPADLVLAVSIAAMFFLALLGALSSYLSGVSLYKGVSRVCFWGALAMLVTGLVGELVEQFL